jgi:5-methylcytosine-specific restriction endonuclease McrA
MMDAQTRRDRSIAFAERVQRVDDDELLGLLFKYVEIADRVDPALTASRLPLIVDETLARGCLESEERSPYADVDYYTLKEYRKDLAMIAYLADDATVQAAIPRLDLRKPRAKRQICPLCARPRLREGDELCSVCNRYLIDHLGTQNGFAEATYISPIVRAFAPICYLCGEEPTDHAEHVIAQARGGSDHLSNIGGACWFCNVSKGDRPLDPTPEQVERLAAQQAALQAALATYAAPEGRDRLWTRYMIEAWEGWIEDAVEDLWEEYPEVDRDEVLDYITQVSEDDREEHPYMPADLEQRAVDEALRRMSRRQD